MDPYSNTESSKSGRGNFLSDTPPRPAKSKWRRHAPSPLPWLDQPYSRSSVLDHEGLLDSCPRCKSRRIVNLVWGYLPITDDLDKRLNSGRVKMCGCCVPCDRPPEYKCGNCHTYIWPLVTDEAEDKWA